MENESGPNQIQKVTDFQLRQITSTKFVIAQNMSTWSSYQEWLNVTYFRSYDANKSQFYSLQGKKKKSWLIPSTTEESE